MSTHAPTIHPEYRIPTLQVAFDEAGGDTETRRRTRVMLVDGDGARARDHAEILGRAEIEVHVLGTVGAARRLLQGSSLPFDAIVVRHRLPDAEGVDLLASVPVAQRRCSVLVIDAQAEPSRARIYREHGVYAYVDEPSGPLEVIGCVHSTACDTFRWRRAGRRSRLAMGEPPRVHLDPAHAADRLAHVYDLAPVEREVAYWVLMGLRDADIAQRLARSERTAKRYVGRILDKAQIQNRASLWAALHHEAGGDAPERARDGEPARAIDGVDVPAPDVPVVGTRHSPVAASASSHAGYSVSHP